MGTQPCTVVTGGPPAVTPPSGPCPFTPLRIAFHSLCSPPPPACESTPIPPGTPFCFTLPFHLQLPLTHLWPPIPNPPACPKATSDHHSHACLDL